MSNYDPFRPLPAAFSPGSAQGQGNGKESRLDMLAVKYPPQWGQTSDVTFPASDTFGSNLVRWQGDETDVRPWRLYLRPWQPKGGTNAFPFATNAYAQPNMWALAQPGIYDSMGISNGSIQLFGRITFGAGGVRHIAYVDWPRRGLLLQLSGSYVQLDAVGVSSSLDPTNIDNTRLPILGATLGEEPGGGDAAAPATYTFPMAAATGAPLTRLFQVPPFARTFTPLIDRASLVGGGVALIAINARETPGGILTDSWAFDPSTAQLGNPTDEQLPIPSLTGVIEITADADFDAGCLFHLDL